MAAVVVAIDVWAIRRESRTLSRVYWEALDTQLGRAIAVGLTAAVVDHLLHPFPMKEQ